MQELHQRQSLWSRLRSFALQSRRVLRVTKKPTMEEFKIILKISAIGVSVIGAIGFIVFLVAEFIR